MVISLLPVENKIVTIKPKVKFTLYSYYKVKDYSSDLTLLKIKNEHNFGSDLNFKVRPRSITLLFRVE